MDIISIREHPEYVEQAIAWFQARWASEASRMVYDDCIRHCVDSASPLPQWYLLRAGNEFIGGAGLIPNDFISRADLWPWVCALHIDPEWRGSSLGSLLLDRAKTDARRLGFAAVYLCTDHVGFYEKYGFRYVATGYHPWGEQSRIYEARLDDQLHV